jgi:hypothetical protein
MALKITDHIKLINYFAEQALIHIKAKKYYNAYIELGKVQATTKKTQELIKDKFSDTETPIFLES